MLVCSHNCMTEVLLHLPVLRLRQLQLSTAVCCPLLHNPVKLPSSPLDIPTPTDPPNPKPHTGATLCHTCTHLARRLHGIHHLNCNGVATHSVQQHSCAGEEVLGRRGGGSGDHNFRRPQAHQALVGVALSGGRQTQVSEPIGVLAKPVAVGSCYSDQKTLMATSKRS